MIFHCDIKSSFNENIIRIPGRSQYLLPRRGFLWGRAKKSMFVRPYVSPSVRPCLRVSVFCHARSARNQQICGKVIGRILDSNLVYNVKIRHLWICDDLVLRTQKVASGPPLPCGCNLVKVEKIREKKRRDFGQNHIQSPHTKMSVH